MNRLPSSPGVALVSRIAACLALTATLAHGQFSFSNQTVSAGVSATHSISSILDPLYPGGGTVGDFDGDGFQDIFWLSGGDGAQADKLFINDGDGTFTDEATAWGIASAHKGKAACTWDYDDDGDLDIYVVSAGAPGAGTQAGAHKLYRNNGNDTFTDVAVAAGVNATVTSGIADGWSASPNDYDLDGDLDLFVGGSLPGNGGSRMFRNNGNGTFTDVTGSIGDGGTGLFAGLNVNVYGFSPRFVDVNGDHYPELLFTADYGTSLFFRNNGDGTFTNWSGPSGTTLEENGMGSSIGDYDRDGNVDWYVTSVYFGIPGWTGNKLYMGNGDLTFSEISDSAGVYDGGYGWGALSIDFDHDGWVDIVEMNGGLCPGSLCVEPAYLWRNNGNETFTEMAVASGINYTLPGRACVNLDIDNDGDQDMALFANNDAFRLYRNDLTPGPTTHWLRVFLDTGARPGLAPHGLGARISVEIGGVKQYRWIDQAINFLSTGELSAHFGLGTATTVDVLRVEWPDGTATELTNVAVDQTLTVAADADKAWADLGGGISGSNGTPNLVGGGPLTPGSTMSLDLTAAPPGATVLLWLSFTSVPLGYFGGTIHAIPPTNQFLLPTNGSGALSIGGVWPPGLPADLCIWFQYLVDDPSVVGGIGLSNAVKATTP
jgi:hypothetical protein